jgi:hypothetical protein
MTPDINPRTPMTHHHRAPRDYKQQALADLADQLRREDLALHTTLRYGIEPPRTPRPTVIAAGTLITCAAIGSAALADGLGLALDIGIGALLTGLGAALWTKRHRRTGAR